MKKYEKFKMEALIRDLYKKRLDQKGFKYGNIEKICTHIEYPLEIENKLNSKCFYYMYTKYNDQRRRTIKSLFIYFPKRLQIWENFTDILISLRFYISFRTERYIIKNNLFTLHLVFCQVFGSLDV